MFCLNTCRILIWGYTHAHYHTHTHIHNGFFRAASFMKQDAKWLDQSSSPPDVDNVLVITNHDVAKYLPVRKDWFYLIHGLNDYADLRERFADVPHLSWNVFHDCSHSHAPGGAGPIPGAVDKESGYLLAEDVPYYPRENRLDFRWATDLLPAEIESHKPFEVLGRDSNEINWVGSVWWVNAKELGEFRRACEEDGVKFNHLGAGQNGVISIDDNIELVRKSCMAPAISGSHHITEGYVPCRIFKNISYGQMGITNSKRVNDLFGGRLIYNPDPYQLYYDAKERLAKLDYREIHALMDEVAAKHTYVQRIKVICQAIGLVMENA